MVLLGTLLPMYLDHEGSTSSWKTYSRGSYVESIDGPVSLAYLQQPLQMNGIKCNMEKFIAIGCSDINETATTVHIRYTDFITKMHHILILHLDHT